MAIRLSTFLAVAEGHVRILQRATTGPPRTFRAACNQRHGEHLSSFKYYVQKDHRRPYLASIHSRNDGAKLADQSAQVATADLRQDGEGLTPAGRTSGLEETAATIDQAPIGTPVEITCRSGRRCRARGRIAGSMFHHGAPAQRTCRAPATRATGRWRPPRSPPAQTGLPALPRCSSATARLGMGRRLANPNRVISRHSHQVVTAQSRARTTASSVAALRRRRLLLVVVERKCRAHWC